MTAGLLVEVEAITAHVEAVLAATAVCEAVLSHPDTTPKQAGEVWLLGRWIASGSPLLRGEEQ